MAKSNILPFKRKTENFFDNIFNQLHSYLSPNIFSDCDTIITRPVTDISEDSEYYNIRCELPGIDKEDININYNNNKISISAKKEENKNRKEEQFHLIESSSRFYQREIYLPNNIEEESIDANLNNGVLEIRIKKSTPETKKKSIEIK